MNIFRYEIARDFLRYFQMVNYIYVNNLLPVQFKGKFSDTFPLFSLTFKSCLTAKNYNRIQGTEQNSV